MRLLSSWWARVRAYFFPAPAINRQAPEPHALDALCARFHCRYERSVFPTGEVQIMLIRPDATLSAVGKTTAEAVTLLAKKATACWGVLE